MDKSISRSFGRTPQWCRVLVRIDSICGKKLRISIPQWSMEQMMEIPRSALPNWLRGKIRIDDWLMASAIISNEEIGGVKIRNLRKAADPNPRDGLA